MASQHAAAISGSDSASQLLTNQRKLAGDMPERVRFSAWQWVQVRSRALSMVWQNGHCREGSSLFIVRGGGRSRTIIYGRASVSTAGELNRGGAAAPQQAPLCQIAHNRPIDLICSAVNNTNVPNA